MRAGERQSRRRQKQMLEASGELELLPAPEFEP
jgi:hypothetical protein